MGLFSSSSWSREPRAVLGLLEVTRPHRPEPECVPNWTSRCCFGALLKESSHKGPCNTHMSVQIVGDCLQEALVWEFVLVATREESGVLGFPSRLGLTTRGSLECNPEMPAFPGEE